MHLVYLWHLFFNDEYNIFNRKHIEFCFICVCCVASSVELEYLGHRVHVTMLPNPSHLEVRFYTKK